MSSGSLWDFPIILLPTEYTNNANTEKKHLVAISDILTPGLEDLLRKILSSIQIRMSDCHLISEDPVIHISDFLQMETSLSVISFGVRPRQLGLQITERLYEPVKLKGKRILFADRLSSIAQDKELKKQLWMGLKETFGK